MNPTTNEVLEFLINQRIRNRIIEVLGLFISLEDRPKFTPNDVINLWEDWVDDERIVKYTEPVFSKKEQLAILKLHKCFKELAENSPRYLPPIEILKDNPLWKSVIQKAKETLFILNKRGRFSEETEFSFEKF